MSAANVSADPDGGEFLRYLVAHEGKAVSRKTCCKRSGGSTRTPTPAPSTTSSCACGATELSEVRKTGRDLRERLVADRHELRERLSGRPAELVSGRPGRPHPREPERRVWRAPGRVGRLGRHDLLPVDGPRSLLAEDALAVLRRTASARAVSQLLLPAPGSGPARWHARPNRVSSIAPEQSHRPEAVSTSRTASRAGNLLSAVGILRAMNCVSDYRPPRPRRRDDGSGKSTFARALAARTGLPVIHLDLHYWKPGWVRPSTTSGENDNARCSLARFGSSTATTTRRFTSGSNARKPSSFSHSLVVVRESRVCAGASQARWRDAPGL